jgi:hypothetical protein
MLARKRWFGLTNYDPKDTVITSKQNMFLAPSNLEDAGLGVFSDTTLRKSDYVAIYSVQGIVSPAEYERDYRGTGRIECDYAFQISTDEVAIGLTKPVAEGMVSEASSIALMTTTSSTQTNCKFMVHEKSVVVVLDIEALPRRQELIVSFYRPF